MSIPEHTRELSPIQRAALVIQDLQARLATLERQTSEPIAVIGIGCRFPGGASTPEEFWRLLRDGVDTVTEVPAERWDAHVFYDPDPDTPGMTYTRSGAFIDHADQFDPLFFGISPREAMSLDPQQRLLLEVAWESLEHAGIPVDSLPTATGLFMGCTDEDYAMLPLPPGTIPDAFEASGRGACFFSGRLAHVLGVRGPAVSLNTACSSSLVAVHLACQSLRTGECGLALAGGVLLNLSPETTMLLAQAKALAPDGRCKTFDAAADGYGRGEGCGVIVLKRLSDAERDGDSILALIRGSATNHDGHSSGLTVPNKLAQQEVIQQALAQAKVQPHEIDYVETHGTGTVLGDPIEVRALDAVLSAGRNTPLLIGSVKTNIGHLEAAAGIASLIKVILSLQHEEIPPHLHFQTPNPYIDWAQMPIQVTAARTPWLRSATRRIAGVSSFGLSGTNAHVIVEEAPPVQTAPERPAPAAQPHVLLLSAKTGPALRDLARRYAEHLAAHPDRVWADICASAATGRSQFDHRVALVADDSHTAQAQLTAFVAGDARAAISGAVLRTSKPKVAFLFTGQGSQYAGMGRQLYETQPVFRAALDECAALLQSHLDVPLLDVVFGTDNLERIDQTVYTQPALFALEYALARQWMAWGIQPAALLGHSVGEYIAACLAGVFTLADALKLVAARGRLMQALPQTGQMVAIQAAPEQVQSALADYATQVALAAMNGPQSVVIAGATEAVQSIATHFAAEGIKTRVLQTSHAFHSPLMNPMLPEFAQVARSISYRPPQMPIASNISGTIAGAEIATPDYWVHHVRQPVQFTAGIQTIAQQGIGTWLELGPQPTLISMAQLCLPEATADQMIWLPSLKRDEAATQTMLTSLAHLAVQGQPIDWNAIYPAGQHQRVSLPTYPFQRQRYWLRDTPRPRQSQPAISTASGISPLTTTVTGAASLDSTTFHGIFSTERLPYMRHHRVYDDIIVPGVTYLALLFSVAVNYYQAPGCLLEDIVFPQALPLPDGVERNVQAVLSTGRTNGNNATLAVQVLSGVPGTRDLTEHMQAQMSMVHALTPSPIIDLVAIQQRCTRPITRDELYARTLAHDIQLGDAFQWNARAWAGTDEALSQIQKPESIDDMMAYTLHPALIDSCFQLCIATMAEEGATRIPFAMQQVRFYAPLDMRDLWCHVQRTAAWTWDVRLFDQTGRVLLDVVGYEAREASQAALLAQPGRSNWLYELTWQPQPLSSALPPATPGRWIIFADTGGIGAALAARLQNQGQQSCLIDADSADLTCPEQVQRVIQEHMQNTSAPLRGIIALWGNDPVGTHGVRMAYARALALVQAVAQITPPPPLWLVTQSAQAVDAGDRPNLAHAPIWGLARTFFWEHPDVRCTCLDLPTTGSADDLAAMLLDELNASDEERQVALRPSGRRVARLNQQQTGSAQHADYHAILANLHQRSPVRKPPWPGTVEVRVHATGVNFWDVLYAMGMITDRLAENLGIDLDVALPFGVECAGEVVAVGADVADIQVGDAVVVAMTTGALQGYVMAHRSFVSPKPAHLTFAEAVTIPMAFLTAAYGLHELAHIQAGDRVLIHAAAGGVGQAAVQLALAAGATVFATASPAKWDFLRTQGVAHVFHSRTLDFADQIATATEGRGVDIVLNSLGDAFIQRSLDILRPGGTFLEIGKRDSWGSDQVAQYRPDVRYYRYDAGALDKPHIAQILAQVMQQVSIGTLKPLPYTALPLHQAASAFQYMQQARHIGKVVITHYPPAESALCAEGSYLITGGLGGIGLKIAEYLVEQGARHLVLASRRSIAPPDAQEVIAQMEARGATVQVVQADVAEQADVERLLSTCQELSPLRGIIHAAGIIDDGAILQQTLEQYDRVAAAKVAGAWHLHTLTRSMPLDFFVLFSSEASLVGSAGQGNYAAANAFLDSLAHYRQHQGLPALSINWGAWAEVGIAARLDTGIQQRLLASGVASITPAEGVRLFGDLLRQDHCQVAVIPTTPAVYLMHGSAAFKQMFAAYARQEEPPTAEERQQSFRVRLEGLPSPEAWRVLQAEIQRQVCQVLRLPAEYMPDPDQGFFEMGLDSLLALELRRCLQTALDITLPATIVFNYPSIAQMTRFVGQNVLKLDQPQQATPAGPDAASVPVTRPDVIEPVELSESEIEALLLAEIEHAQKEIKE